MNLGTNLLQYAKSIGIASQKDLAKKIQENEKTISSYITGKSYPTYKKLIKLCNLLNCDPNTLMKNDYEYTSDEFSQQDQQILSAYQNLSSNPDKKEIVDFILGIGEYDIVSNPIETEPPKIYLIPVYQQDVAAGSGQLGFDQKHEMEEFYEPIMPKKISYGIKIKGNSMETDDENNIPDECTILVTTEFDYDQLIGEAVVVNIGGVLVCKEYNIAEDGHLWLKSRNRNKSNEDKHIYDIDGVKIIGKVIKVIYP